QITVSAAGERTCTPGPGVRFTSSQFAVAGIIQTQQTSFAYDIRAVSGQPVLSDIELSLTTFLALAAGVIDVTETVRDPSQAVLGTPAVHVTSFAVTPPTRTNTLALSPAQPVVSVAVDILLAKSDPESPGSAVLSDFGNNAAEVCLASVQVTKQIACLPCVADISCETLPPEAYSGAATGYQSDTASPVFCYNITITNTGSEALQNITVTDSSGLDLSGCFPAGLSLPAEGSSNCLVAVSLDADATNTVTVAADGAVSLTHVTASASATATVLRAMLDCPADVTVQCAADLPVPAALTDRKSVV